MAFYRFSLFFVGFASFSNAFFSFSNFFLFFLSFSLRLGRSKELSFNLLLSDPASFEGGGTCFTDAELEEVIV